MCNYLLWVTTVQLTELQLSKNGHMNNRVSVKSDLAFTESSCQFRSGNLH